MIEPTQIAMAAKMAAIAFLMLFHVQFAGILQGIFGIGPAMELFGVLSSKHPFFDHFAHRLAFVGVVIYSTGAVLAIIFIIFTTLTFPSFWYSLVRITFWPLVLEAMTFVLQAVFLFPWYYTWRRLVGPFKSVHLALGAALLVAGQLQMAMIDVVASYLLSPTPSGATPLSVFRVIFNPTSIPLDLHRLVGNFSLTGFVIAGYAAFRMLRAREEERRAYYDWMGSVGLIIGVGFLFMMPAIGIEYVEEIRANSPGVFTLMMRGGNSWLFLILTIFVSILFVLSVWYMLVQVRKSERHGQGLLLGFLVIIGLSALMLIQPYVIGPSQYYYWVNWVNPVGSMQPWRYLAFAAMTLAAMAALITYLSIVGRGIRWGSLRRGARGAQYALLSVAILTSATMALMGYIRENSRSPFLIYYQWFIQAPEQFPTVSPTPTPDESSSRVLPGDTSDGAGGALVEVGQ